MKTIGGGVVDKEYQTYVTEDHYKDGKSSYATAHEMGHALGMCDNSWIISWSSNENKYVVVGEIPEDYDYNDFVDGEIKASNMRLLLKNIVIGILILLSCIVRISTKNIQNEVVKIRHVSISTEIIDSKLNNWNLKLYSLYLKVFIYLEHKDTPFQDHIFIMGKIDLTEVSIDSLPLQITKVMGINYDSEYDSFKIYNNPFFIDTSKTIPVLLIPSDYVPKTLTKVKLNLKLDGSNYLIFQNGCCGIDDSMRLYEANISSDTLYLNYIFDFSTSKLIKRTKEELFLDTLDF